MVYYTQKDCGGTGIPKKCYCKDCDKSFKIYVPDDNLEASDYPPKCKFCNGHHVEFKLKEL